MSEREEMVFDVRVDGIETAKAQMASLQQQLTQTLTLLYGVLGILRELGLPDEMEKVITTVMRLISVVNMLRASLMALHAASGPYGWAMAMIGFVGTTVTLASTFEMEMRMYQ